MYRTVIIYLVLTSWLTSTSYADEHCGTQQNHEALMGASKDYNEVIETFNIAAQEAGNHAGKSTEVYTLPVVVHVMHRGSAIGELENISDQQVMSAIRAMNEDFRRMPGTNGDGNGVDTLIQFTLAQRTPAGEPTNGIIRVNTAHIPQYAEHGIANDVSRDGADQFAVKSLSSWDVDRYVNIFVVTEINGNDGGNGTQGFAFLGPTQDERDGVVVLYNAFGTVGTLKPGRHLNRTATHEVGHYLGLFHVFNLTNACDLDRNCETTGDRVCDTPETMRNESCQSSACDNAHLSNYMDYTPGACKSAFTQGQATRMRAMIETSRSTLLDSLGAIPVVDTDLLVAGLMQPGSVTCIGDLTAQVIVRNQGTEQVQGFMLSGQLNDEAAVSQLYENVLNPGETATVSLPVGMSIVGANHLDVTVGLPSGEPDDFPSNDALAHSFTLEQSDYFTLELNTDAFAREIDWVLEDDGGNALMNAPLDGYPTGAETYHAGACVPTGCHVLKLYDTAGDGLCTIDFDNDGVCDQGGTLTLTAYDGTVLVDIDATVSNYGSEATFEVCTTGLVPIEWAGPGSPYLEPPQEPSDMPSENGSDAHHEPNEEPTDATNDTPTHEPNGEPSDAPNGPQAHSEGSHHGPASDTPTPGADTPPPMHGGDQDSNQDDGADPLMPNSEQRSNAPLQATIEGGCNQSPGAAHHWFTFILFAAGLRWLRHA